MIFRGRKGNILPMNCVPKQKWNPAWSSLVHNRFLSEKAHWDLLQSWESFSFLYSQSLSVKSVWANTKDSSLFPYKATKILCPFSHFLIQESSLVCVIFKSNREYFQCRNKARTKKAIVKEESIVVHIEGQRLLFFFLCHDAVSLSIYKRIYVELYYKKLQF